MEKPVPAGGWHIHTVSTFFGVLGTPGTATEALLVVFDKDIGQPDPMDHATVVQVSMEREEFTDPNTGWSRNTCRYDAFGLSLLLAQGEYWMGVTNRHA